MSYYYNKPKDFESFIYVGQVLQARGLKLAIEAHRCDMPRCMGSLYWQLNDCWPVASWSSTDYYGRWKALHYTVKKAFAPVMVTASVADSVVDIALVSDKLMNWKTTLTCKIIDFGGDVKWERSMPVTFKSNASTRLSLKLDSLELSGKQKRQCLLLITTDPTTLPTDPCVVYFNYPNAIDLPPVKVTSQVSCSGQSCSIRLKTDVLAKDVYIEIPGNGLLSDNYFDMMPGEIKVVEVTNSSVQIAPGDVKIKTLLDTY